MQRLPILFLLSLLPGECVDPPITFEIRSPETSDAIQECVRSPRGDALFPGLKTVAVSRMSFGVGDHVLRADNGDQIGIYTLIGDQHVVLRSAQAPSKEQIEFLSDCAND
jgi:hypothetical protein